MKKLMTIISIFTLSIQIIFASNNLETQVPANIPYRGVVNPKIASIYVGHDHDFRQIAANLVEAAKDKEILGIILTIDSYGGTSTIFSGLHDLVKRITKMKPVISLVIGAALSGGYLIASATDYIFAQSLSDLGHIGVILEVAKYREGGFLDPKLNVEVFYAGEYKALHNPYKELTEEDKVYIKSGLETSYKYFVKMVAENRKLNLEHYKTWAEAKIFIAPEALKLGLIDEIGTVFEAEQKIVELIRVKHPYRAVSDQVEVKHFDPRRDYQFHNFNN